MMLAGRELIILKNNIDSTSEISSKLIRQNKKK